MAYVTEEECGRSHKGLILLLTVGGTLLLGAGAQVIFNTTRIAAVELKTEDAAKTAAESTKAAEKAATLAEETSKKLDRRLDKFEEKLDRLLTK